MKTQRQSLLHLVKNDTGFAMAALSAVAFTVFYTCVSGPPPSAVFSMLGLLAATAVIEFRYKPPE